MTKTAIPTAKCTECGRTCKRNARRRDAALVLAREFKNPEAAATKALALLTDRALVPTRHAGQYLAAATDGTQTYLVDTVERSCTCKGHTRVGRCYHLVAADVVELTTARRRSFALAA